MHINASFHVRPLAGESKPHLMVCEDKELYLVKFAWNPLGPQSLVSDFISSRLARSVGLPVPDCRPIRVSPYLIATTPELLELWPAARAYAARDRPEDQLHFGSALVGPEGSRCASDAYPFDLLDPVRDADKFPAAFALAAFCQCAKPPRPIFFRSPVLEEYSVAFVDFSYGFHTILTGREPAATESLSSHRGAYDAVTGFDSFEPYIERIASLQPEDIERICQEVPSCWCREMPSLREAIAQTLVERRSTIYGIVAKACASAPSVFPRWRLKPIAVSGASEMVAEPSIHMPEFG